MANCITIKKNKEILIFLIIKTKLSFTKKQKEC